MDQLVHGIEELQRLAWKLKNEPPVRDIPDQTVHGVEEPLAFNFTNAARLIGFSTRSLRREIIQKKIFPTALGMISREECERYLRDETAAARQAALLPVLPNPRRTRMPSISKSKLKSVGNSTSEAGGKENTSS